MAKFLLHSTFVVGLNLLLFFGWQMWASEQVRRRGFGNWETESSLLALPSNQRVDIVLLGSSHARNFSRAKNHLRVEEILGKEVVNLSKGNGGGIVPMTALLETFFDHGNRASVIVYFIDPWVFHSATWNEQYSDLAGEPFSASFLVRLVENGVEPWPIYTYLRSKFNPSWLQSKPQSPETMATAVAKRDEQLVSRRIQNLYNQGLDEGRFEAYGRRLEKVVRLAQDRKARLVFVLSPTLLGDEPGRERLVQLLEAMRRDYQTDYYDLTTAIQEPALFEDHDHLNTAGVVAFTSEYLKSIVEGKEPSIIAARRRQMAEAQSTPRR